MIRHASSFAQTQVAGRVRLCPLQEYIEMFINYLFELKRKKGLGVNRILWESSRVSNEGSIYFGNFLDFLIAPPHRRK